MVRESVESVREHFTGDVSLDKEVSINFASHSIRILDPKLHIRTGSALMEHKVCAV